MADVVAKLLEQGGEEALDAALDMARSDDDVDLSGSDTEIGDALIARLADRSRFLHATLRAEILRGLWRWGVSSCTSVHAKRAFLCALVDEDALDRQIRIDAAVMLSLMDDRESMMALASRLHLDVVSPHMASHALMKIDPSEAYDELAHRYRESAEWRYRIARSLDRRADPRWIDEATRIASSDPLNAVATLSRVGGDRAIEELSQWVARARSIGDDGVLEALYALERFGVSTDEERRRLSPRNPG